MVQQGSSVLGGPGKVLVAVPVSSGSTRATVVVVTSLDQYNNSVSVVQRLLEIGMPLFLILVGVICWMIVGRALRPIERMRREVAEVATTQRAHRIPEPATNDEVGRLARTLNSMLDRIEASSRRERRFVSDASHELRSPLANIRTEIEVALHHPTPGRLAGRGQGRAGPERAYGPARRGAAVAGPFGRGGTDAGGRAGRPGRRWWRRPLPPGPVGSPMSWWMRSPPRSQCRTVYLERMVSNLVGNARRFARSQVSVSVRPEGPMGVLTVQDDGPGVPESERTRIFERFVRLDEARDRGEGGFGVGAGDRRRPLSILRRDDRGGRRRAGRGVYPSLPRRRALASPEPIKEPAAV